MPDGQFCAGCYLPAKYCNCDDATPKDDNAWAYLGRRIAVNDKVIEKLSRENRDLRKAQAEAVELAKDVAWFVRMQAISDSGAKQCVDKAKTFLKAYGGGG